jgi:EmrB/QacA subfamily drug resistance transporter
MERKWKVLLLISIGSFMAFLDAPVLSVAFPALESTFKRVSVQTLAWTLDAYFIGFAAFLVVAGKVADRYGRRRLFVSGMALFTLGSLACALAPSAGALIAARVLQATGAALVVPAGQGLMLAEFPVQERKTAIGALAALVGLGTAAAPSIGGLIVDGLGWRWIFGLNVAGSLIAIGYALRLLAPDVRSGRRGQLPDLGGAAMQATSLGLLVFGILKSPDWGLGDGRTLAAFALAAGLLVAFVWRCRRHAAPVIDLSLFRNRTFAVANLSSIALGIGLYAMAINSVLYFTQVWRWTILAAGLAFIPGSLVSAATGKPAGRLAERYGARIVGFCGASAAGLGVLLIAASTTASSNYAGAFLPGQLLYGVGLVAAMAGLVGAALTSVPAAQFAEASGINNALRQVGGAIGVALVAAIVGNSLGSQAVHRGHASWIIGGGTLLLAGTLALLIPKPQRAVQTDPGRPARKLVVAEAGAESRS